MRIFFVFIFLYTFLFQQFIYRICENLRIDEQALFCDKFVSAVHMIVLAGESAPKSHAAARIVHIGTAADGDSLALKPRLLLVNAQERADKVAVFVNVMRLCARH